MRKRGRQVSACLLWVQLLVSAVRHTDTHLFIRRRLHESDTGSALSQ